MARSGVKLKGVGIKPTVEYIQKNFGKEEFTRVLSAVDPITRDHMKGTLLVTSWYDVEDNVDLLLTADKLLGNGDGRMVATASAFSAEFSMNTIYRVFFKLGSPGFIIDRASSLWDKYYSHGKMTVIEKGANKVVLELSDFPYESEEWCGSVSAYMGRILSLTGIKNSAMIHRRCRSKGAPKCRWEGTWS